MLRMTRRRMAALLAATATLAMAGLAQAAGEPITVGVIANLTGNDVKSSLAMVHGIELGVEEVNAQGGVAGRPLKLIVEDSEYRTPEALNAATKLYDADGVQAVIMFGGSSLMLPVAEMAKQKGRVLINASSSSPKLGDYPGTLFSILPLDDVVGGELGRFIAKRGPKTAVLVAPNNTFGAGLVDAAAKAFEAAGGKVEGRVLYTEGQPDYRPDVQTIARAKPEAVIVAGYGDDSATVFKNARLLGLAMPWYAAYPSILSVENADWMNGKLFGIDNGGYGNKVGQKVEAAYKAKYGETPTPHAYYGYDGVMLLARAMAGGTEAAAIAKALPGALAGYEGATGTITWDARGQRTTAPLDLFAYEGGALKETAGQD